MKESNVNHSRTPEETTSIVKHRADAFHYRRAALTSVHPDTHPANIMATAIRHRPFDFATSVFEITKLPGLYPCDPPKWFSTLQHAFIVWAGLVSLGPDFERLINFAAGRLRKLARIHLAPVHPAIARDLYEKLDKAAGIGKGRRAS